MPPKERLGYVPPRRGGWLMVIIPFIDWVWVGSRYCVYVFQIDHGKSLKIYLGCFCPADVNLAI